MVLAKKDRFVDEDINIVVGNLDNFNSFKYKSFNLTILGKSNKNDLIPVNVTNTEMQRIVTLHNLNQYICTDEDGNIFDASLYDKDGKVYLNAIRTREKPDKPKKKKE